MIINAVNVNEFLRLGFLPSTLIVLKDNQYYVEDSEFEAFAEGQEWEKGLDYTVDSNNELDVHIVLEESGSSAGDLAPDYEDDEADVEDQIEGLRQIVRSDMRDIKDRVSSGRYCSVQLGLLKDILLG